MQYKYKTSTPDETRSLAAQLAKKTAVGTVYGLTGGLGAGKTEFVRGFVAVLAPDTMVCSPSFTLVNTYRTDSFPIYHFDFYRLNDPDELIEIGYEEYITDYDAVVFIEWADMFPDVLPEHTQFIHFKEVDRDHRIISVE